MVATTNGKQQAAETGMVVHSQTESTLGVYRMDDVAMGLGFTEIQAMGETLCKTGFLPKHIQNGAQFAAIVIAGREMGIPTMRAVRTLKLVMGNVTEDAAAQLARFKADGGRAQFRELTATRAVLWLRHPNGDEHVETFTIEDAKRAKLHEKNGSMWNQNPTAMLRSRSITAGLKSVGWNGAPGVYDENELADIAPQPAPVQRQAARAAAPAPSTTQKIADAVAAAETQEAVGEVVNPETGEVTAAAPVESVVDADLERLRACADNAARVAFVSTLKGKYAKGSQAHTKLLEEFNKLQGV